MECGDFDSDLARAWWLHKSDGPAGDGCIGRPVENSCGHSVAEIVPMSIPSREADELPTALAQSPADAVRIPQ